MDRVHEGFLWCREGHEGKNSLLHGYYVNIDIIVLYDIFKLFKSCINFYLNYVF